MQELSLVIGYNGNAVLDWAVDERDWLLLQFI